jgi:peptidoglycan/xylan/chitin deacetylase (PgdA/CDA1 family)
MRIAAAPAAALAAVLLAAAPLRAAGPAGDPAVPILVYHRLAPTVLDSMTVSLPVFESQLAYLADHGYTAIPLSRLVAWLAGEAPAPPPRSVVLTADDGHRSVYERMLPIVRRAGLPVTLFVYPSAISNASYALTWPQVRELAATGLFDIQSHTLWHPNLLKERAAQAPEAFARFVDAQLRLSKARIERETGAPVQMLAWPFGLYDADLMRRAAGAGYRAAFTIERRHARRGDDLMALPRYLITDLDRGERFGRLLAGPGGAAGGGR